MNSENGINASSDAEEGKLLKLPDFREKITAGLVASAERRPVGRPSAAAGPSQIPTGTIQRTKHPVEDVRSFSGLAG